jgi:hypothetical protein
MRWNRVNLLLYTIELDPGGREDGADLRPRDVETRRRHRLRRIGLAILTALCVFAAGLSGWLIQLGDKRVGPEPVRGPWNGERRCRG